MEKKHYFVYMMTNKHHNVLYTGVTSNLAQRTWQHKNKAVPGFASKYNVAKLVYYEEFDDPESAILREKQIKGGSRARKLAMIEVQNPSWKDLAEDFE